MSLPFTADQFFDVMRRYNEGVWPAQLTLLGMALAVVALLASRRPIRDPLIAATLALLWFWSGIVYHLVYFYAINPAAVIFAAVFLAGGGIFGWLGVIRRRLQFEFARGMRGVAGAALLVYALVVYPLLAAFIGHTYPQTPSFGMPCPTTLFTVGVLAFVRGPFPRYLFIAPVLWALIGSQVAFAFGVYEDYGLVVAAAVGIWLALQRSVRPRLA